MMGIGAIVTSLLAAGAVAAGGLLGTDSAQPIPRQALVIDAAVARDGRELIDARLHGIDAELRLPRTSAEAVTNVRYFAAQDYSLVVAGTRAGDAADAADVTAVHASDLTGALSVIAER